ncbi:valine--tRNA ligase [Segnochrobactraceae bacterium EtOH-i3]
MLDKTYDAAAIEPRISQLWEDAQAFRAGANARPGAPSFSIVIPPPNVTGSLHMGHALNNTLQDVLARFNRMRGLDVLWQPGTDHAGIATQSVVERQMMQRQEPDRRTIGREKFLEKVWTWKAESGGTIMRQLRRLGASCDFSRERFTMDEGLSRAVLEVFVTLYKQGLIYKDKRLVNWDPKLLTAISDLEVLSVEVKGKLWYLRYPIEGRTFSAEDPASYIVVATTRPETMLGDTAVVVHPEDPRFAELLGKNVVLPLTGRLIPIVGDDYVDMETGTGAMKVTPAHDFNDFEIGKRHNLGFINVLDIEGRIALANNAEFLAGLPESADLTETLTLDGVERFKARDRVVAMLEARGLLEKIEPHPHKVPHGDRSGVVIEPFLTDQWYVDAHTLAQPAIAAVKDGRTNFVPKNWEKTYFEWMENIQPWCVSRQLWWGHQIPAWYGPDGTIFVEKSEAEANAAAEKHYGAPTELTRDPDVLDTWFSSALWPFSTMGWPDETPELKRYYPTSVLITGFDIIFFWVARMMMMGLHFMKDEAGNPEIPFHDIYIHALVRDEKGAKMSKSKGNVIDPLSLIDEFGADAVRFTLTAMAAQGRDIKLATSRVGGYRAFATKLWNAARFAEMNGCVAAGACAPETVTTTLSRWIVVETGRTADAVSAALEAYRFNEAAAAIYKFTWGTFCDWYLELVKPVLLGDDDVAKAEARMVTAWVLEQILRLLHPFMPFVTEELWAQTAPEGQPRAGLLAHANWPAPCLNDTKAADEINLLVELVSAIRSVRAETNVPAGAQIPLQLVGGGEAVKKLVSVHGAAIKRLARISDIVLADKPPAGSAQMLIGGGLACLPLKGIIDLDAERARLEKELAKIDADVARIDTKLGNADFIARAPEEVVDEQKERREDALTRSAKVREALERLKTPA